MRIRVPLVAAVATFCLWMPNLVQSERQRGQPQPLFVKTDAIESSVASATAQSKSSLPPSTSRRIRRQSNIRAGSSASADKMVQNILQWLQGVYTQNSRRIRQGTLREYLPPTNTQRPRPFQPINGAPAPGGNQGQVSEDNYIGYPPTDVTPQPGFPLPPSTGNVGYPSPPPDITPPISVPDYSGGGYPKQPQPHPGFPTPTQTTPRPIQTTGEYPTSGYPSRPFPGTSSTGAYPTTGYQTTNTYISPSSVPSTPRPGGYPTATPPSSYPTGFPTAPPPGFSTGFPTGPPPGFSTGFPTAPPPGFSTGFPTGPPPGFSTGYPTSPTPGYPTGFPTAPPPGYPSTVGQTEGPPHGGTTPSEHPETEVPEHRPEQPPYTSEPVTTTTTAASPEQEHKPNETTKVELPDHPTEEENTISPPEDVTHVGEGSEELGQTTDANKPKDSQEEGKDEDLKHPPHIHDITVECAKDMMTINIEFNRKFDGVIYSKGFYSNSDCRYVKENSGQTKYIFTVSLNSCGTEFINGFDQPQSQSYLENVLVLQNEPGIQEVWDTIRAVRCLWEGNLNKALSVGLSVGMLNQEIITFSGDTAMAMLDIQLGKGPFAPPANGLVKIGEVMTLVVSVSGDPGFDIQVKDCRAKDSSGDNEVALTDNNGCVLKPKLFGAFQKTRNTGNTGASIIAYAFFNAFKFPDVMDLMIECNVELCKTDCEVCPDSHQQLEPGRRRKRRDISVLKGIPNNSTSSLGEPVTIGKRVRIFVPEDVMSDSVLASLDAQPNQVCVSVHTFLFASIVLLSLFCVSSVLCAYLWLRDKSRRLISKSSY